MGRSLLPQERSAVALGSVFVVSIERPQRTDRLVRSRCLLLIVVAELPVVLMAAVTANSTAVEELLVRDC